MDRFQIPQNLTALAYQSIKRFILEGKLDLDSRLTEESISKELGISKSPVREALNSLQAEGLIRIEPRRGAYLRQFTFKEVEDLYHLREALEVYAVSVAKIVPQLILDLNSSIERTDKYLRSNNKIKHIEEDMIFHGTIASATENVALCRVLQNIQNQIWLCRCRTYDLSSSTAVKAHLSILNALKRNDMKRAQTAMANHISHVRNHLIDFVKREQVNMRMRA